jgi:hypothetical protein
MQGGSVLLRRLLTKVDQHSTGVDNGLAVEVRGWENAAVKRVPLPH